MKKLFLLLLSVSILLNIAYGLTTGDIAFIAYNVDGDDDFAIVALADIPANTTIYFTDNEPSSDGTGLNDYNEGALEWSSGTSVISAGTVIVFTDTDASSNANFGASTGTLSIASFDTAPNLAAGGDAFYAFEGDPSGSGISVWLAGFQNESGNQGSNFSQTGLTSGTTFIEGYTTGNPDGGYYSGARTGESSFSDYLTLLNNTSNWTYDDSNGENILPISTTSFETSGASAPDDPTSFAASATSSSQIDLSWAQNGNTDNVMIVYDTDNTFTDPVDGSTYSVSSSSLGGTVIYNQSGTSFSHTSLSSGTQYYYKAWSVDGSNNYSAGVTDNATTIKAEPTNHPSTFASTSDHNSINLTWSDNDGAIVADGFMIKASSTSIEDIPPAVDGTAEADDTDLSDGSAVINLSHGTETYEFTGLDSETTYYFVIWAYTNSGSNIDYKTDRPLISQSKATTAAPSYILNLDFETSGGYSTSVTEFGVDGDTYFERTDGTDVTDSFTNPQGSYFFAAQDIDGNSGTPPFYLNIDDVDISNNTDLEFSIYLAEGDDGSNQDWDSGDYMHISYDIDNSGTFTNLLWVENDGTTYNTAPQIDTNFDGNGEGTEITSAFAEFTASITGTGSLIDIKIEFGGLTSADEDIALDNIRITGTAAATSVDNPTNFQANASGSDLIELEWTKNASGDNVMIVYDLDNTFTDPVDGTTYSVSSSALGGTVIYNSSGTMTSHESLTSDTHYYYKAWSVDGSNNYSSGVSDDISTLKAEASNHVASFAGSSDHNSVTLTWTDNDGAVVADNYRIKASSTSLAAISDPIDGDDLSGDSDLSDGSANVTVAHGVQTYEFSGLSAESTYYFKIWPITNSGNDLDYKTDGTIPSVTQATTEAPAGPIIFISEVSDPSDVANAKFVEFYNAGGSSVDFSADSWYIARQANGGTWADIALTGTIAAGGTYVIAYNQTTFETEFAPTTADQYHGSISGNGDDGYFLYSGGDHSSGTLVDAYGVIDQDGSGYDWEYLDAVAVRNSSISEPNTTWTSSEWTITDPGNVADCTPGSHTVSAPTVDSPGSFAASAASASQINLSWTLNGNSDTVLVVYDTDGSFTDPVDATDYTVSSSALGGTVIYKGVGTSFNHTGLSGATHYYYRAWSLDGSTSYSNSVSADETTVTAEPSNHVTSFSASSTSSSITLTWSDNDGAIAAHDFLIKASSSSFVAISDPTDASTVSDDTDLSDGSGAINVTHGTQTYTWTGLNASTTYYFKIYPYTNSGSNIDYKTDGLIPSGSQATSAPVKIIISEMMINPDAVGDVNGEWFEIYNAGTETVNIDGWTLSDDGTDSHTIDNGGTLNIAANAFLVLGIDSSSVTNGDYPCDYKYSNFSLANGGDEIIIKDGSTEIDRVAYDDGTNWPIPVGASAVFTGTDTDDNNLYGNWGTATLRQNNYNGETGDKGSPGTKGNDQALPVTLELFTAEYVNGVITLNWTTESETDNACFLVYRNEEIIASIDGAGTTSERNTYSITDPFIIPGMTYTYVLADLSYANIETRHTDMAITIMAGQEASAMSYSIGKAFPNPFNPATLIPVNLATEKYVMADLYDLKGRKIRNLINQNMNAGSHELYIDGRDLSTGVYVVRILVDEQLQIQKIALMK